MFICNGDHLHTNNLTLIFYINRQKWIALWFQTFRMQAVHLAYTEAQNSSQEPQLISATCTFHKMEHITHDHRWNIAIQCLLKSLYVNVFVCNCLYISFTRANRNLAMDTMKQIYQVYNLVFLFFFESLFP